MGRPEHHRIAFAFAIAGALIGLVAAFQFDAWSVYGTGDWIPAGKYPRILIIIAGAALLILPPLVVMLAGAALLYVLGRAIAPLLLR